MWSGWPVIQHASIWGSQWFLFTRVKRRKRIQLKLFSEVMIWVYRCIFTRKGDMSQQIRPISLYIFSLRVDLRNFMECKHSTFVLFEPFLKTVENGHLKTVNLILNILIVLKKNPVRLVLWHTFLPQTDSLIPHLFSSKWIRFLVKCVYVVCFFFLHLYWKRNRLFLNSQTRFLYFLYLISELDNTLYNAASTQWLIHHAFLTVYGDA